MDLVLQFGALGSAYPALVWGVLFVAFIAWLMLGENYGASAMVLMLILALVVVAFAPGNLVGGFVKGVVVGSDIVRMHGGGGPAATLTRPDQGQMETFGWVALTLTFALFAFLVLRREWAPLWAAILIVLLLGPIMEFGIPLAITAAYNGRDSASDGLDRLYTAPPVGGSTTTDPAASGQTPAAPPAATAAPTASAADSLTTTYVVQPGDTLFNIALRICGGASVADVARASGITNPNAISVGQVITCPP